MQAMQESFKSFLKCSMGGGRASERTSPQGCRTQENKTADQTNKQTNKQRGPIAVSADNHENMLARRRCVCVHAHDCTLCVACCRLRLECCALQVACSISPWRVASRAFIVARRIPPVPSVARRCHVSPARCSGGLVRHAGRLEGLVRRRAWYIRMIGVGVRMMNRLRVRIIRLRVRRIRLRVRIIRLRAPIIGVRLRIVGVRVRMIGVRVRIVGVRVPINGSRRR
jgi:hypothetical protein